jgi:hypothetical protein
MPLGKRTFLINPLNNNVDGFSHKNGNPVVKFSIPAQNLLLESTTLRLSGKLQIKNQNGVLIDADGYTASYNQDADDVAQSAQCAINLSNFGGVHNCIDKIVITSKKTKVELVNESNYAQYTSLRQGVSANKEEYLRLNLSRSMSSGNNCDLVNRRIVPSANATFTTDTEQLGQNFSVKLNIPMIQLYPLHLGNDFLGGLEITLYLAPDAAVFCSRNRHLGSTHTASNDPTGASYNLKELKLNGRYIIPDENDLKNYNPELVYSDKVNLINDVHSSVNSSGYTPQVQFVQGVVNQFQRGDVVNNYTLNQNNSPQVIGLKRVVQSKNNLRFPYDFPVEVVPNFEDTTPANLHFKSLSMGDSEVRVHHLRALTGRTRPTHTSADLNATEADMASQYTTASANVSVDTGFNLNCDLTGVGADYSFGIGLTQNYVNQDYAVELNSGVNTGNSNLPTDTNNTTLLQNTFVKDFETLDLQKLVKTF